METFLRWAFVVVPIAVFAVTFALLNYWGGGADISAWLDKPVRDATMGDVTIFIVLLMLGSRK